MKTYRQLREKWILKTNPKDYRSMKTDVYKNPNRKELKSLGVQIRGFIDGKDVYMWSAGDSRHHEMFGILKGEFKSSLPSSLEGAIDHVNQILFLNNQRFQMDRDDLKKISYFKTYFKRIVS